MADSKPRKASAKTLDMSKAGERSEFRRTRIPRGSYRATVTKVVEVAKKKEPGQTQWLFSIALKHPQYRAVFPYYCGFGENELWKIRNLLTAVGKAVPGKRLKVDPNVAVGKDIGIEVDDDEYDGKEQSQIVDIFNVRELAERQTGDVEVDEDDDEDEDDTDDDDSDEDADEDEDEDEDEDDDEPVQRPKKSKKVAPEAKSKKSKKRPTDDVDDDELEELELDED